MKQYLEKDGRRSFRLKDYDYSRAGAYFVTICTQGKKNLFGEILKENMFLNEMGRIVEKWWAEIENKFKNVELDEFVIMPNHFHGIIIIVGADLCVCPDKMGEHVGSPLHRIVQWFKTMSTNEYIRNVCNHGWTPFSKRLWQRNYYEHIIRNEEKLNKIRYYIQTNPLKWHLDRENRQRIGSDELEDEIFISKRISQLSRG